MGIEEIKQLLQLNDFESKFKIINYFIEVENNLKTLEKEKNKLSVDNDALIEENKKLFLSIPRDKEEVPEKVESEEGLNIDDIIKEIENNG